MFESDGKRFLRKKGTSSMSRQIKTSHMSTKGIQGEEKKGLGDGTVYSELKLSEKLMTEIHELRQEKEQLQLDNEELQHKLERSGY
mmetsp:Transcript_12705/g.12557  ORF Transcript_12705/g.12557 Transcript_12705/m.12557 type:complete len:86 (-) Transcript_12705:1170-1427(-)